MNFTKFVQKFNKHFEQMTKEPKYLFEVECDPDELWNLYLESFPAGSNEVYRSRREHDCGHCRHFVKSFGNIVVIKNNQIETVWGFDAGDATYQPVVDALDAFIKSKRIAGVHFAPRRRVGMELSHEYTGTEVHTWNHLYVDVPDKFIFIQRHNNDINYVTSQYRDTKNVFARSLNEVSMDALETVLELIASNTLYRGKEWEHALNTFVNYKKEFDNLTEAEKDCWLWTKALETDTSVGRIRNHSIGVLLTDLSKGEDLEAAVRRYEMIVAPSNYKRPKAIFTQRMLEDAKKTIQDLGYMNSLQRRFANINDISVRNILFANKNEAASMKDFDLFAEMKKEVNTKPKKFDRVTEIGIEDFIQNVLPTASALDVYLENRLAPNFMSLIAPADPTAPSMFKWDNGFSWAYSGNITDSQIRENVKRAGGAVDGVLRCSLQWNDGTKQDGNDLDLHCMTPTCHIYFGTDYDNITKGELDVDIITPKNGIPAVENITWPSTQFMKDGKYEFFVHCYSDRGGDSGFKAEIEFNGEIFSYSYTRKVRQSEKISVATVTYNKNTGFSIEHHLDHESSSREIWGLNSNNFVPVTAMMYSPNYWDDQRGIGHKHYFFMLRDCVNPETPNGFYNEFLKEDLMKHKKVFEALGSKTAVAVTDNQLSGVGFSSTKENHLVVKVTGATERVLKIKF